MLGEGPSAFGSPLRLATTSTHLADISPSGTEGPQSGPDSPVHGSRHGTVQLHEAPTNTNHIPLSPLLQPPLKRVRNSPGLYSKFGPNQFNQVPSFDRILPAIRELFLNQTGLGSIAESIKPMPD
ncbi:hypothetical protein KSP39_PZI006705 [Platanthera zijinensis]|uniref:Uncharacterized protein n=1 Tax=Platanthera zijinensis TaxID=2320716 RepID=A0AAP0G9M4_9ASPA